MQGVHLCIPRNGGDTMNNIVNIISIVLFLACWILIIIRVLCSKYASGRCVEAEVVDKFKANTVSKYPKVFAGERYVVVFKTKDKKLSFNVSEFSFENYRINEKGRLRYKGKRIIGFD